MMHLVLIMNLEVAKAAIESKRNRNYSGAWRCGLDGDCWWVRKDRARRADEVESALLDEAEKIVNAEQPRP